MVTAGDVIEEETGPMMEESRCGTEVADGAVPAKTSETGGRRLG